MSGNVLRSQCQRAKGGGGFSLTLGWAFVDVSRTGGAPEKEPGFTVVHFLKFLPGNDPLWGLELLGDC